MERGPEAEGEDEKMARMQCGADAVGAARKYNDAGRAASGCPCGGNAPELKKKHKDMTTSKETWRCDSGTADGHARCTCPDNHELCRPLLVLASAYMPREMCVEVVASAQIFGWEPCGT
jgi:hypothetical protein